jgi:hypothetical protein
MPQIVRTVNDVIVNALYLTGELGVGETPDGFMITTGLELVNEILDKFTSDSSYITFLTTIAFDLIVGKDTYSVSDMMTADITSDRIVDLSFANYFVPANGNPGNAIPISNPFTADSVTSLLTLGSTISYPTNTPVTISTTGTVPSPLVASTTYYTIQVSPTTLYLASTSANALLGIFIPILTDGLAVNTLTTYNYPTLQPVNASLSYPMRIINKATYYNVVRQTNLLARPGFIFLNKQPNESFLTVYPSPDQPYHCEIQVKSMINSLANQETLMELAPNYYGFLKYAVARKFLNYYPSANWTPQAEDEYLDYYMTFKNTNETDLTIRPSVTMTAPEPFYWPNILSY